jgi:hypothetical protein
MNFRKGMLSKFFEIILRFLDLTKKDAFKFHPKMFFNNVFIPQKRHVIEQTSPVLFWI